MGLISDTHIPSRARRVPKKVYEAFRDVDLIVHAGDLTQFRVIESLERLATVVGVRGNMDDLTVLGRLPKFKTVEVYGWKIGVVHTLGSLFGIKRMRKIVRDHGLDVLVFGHTHRPYQRREKNVLYINPGSPTVPLPQYIIKPSVALLRVTRERVKAEIIKI